jgi:hypothetical protein
MRSKPLSLSLFFVRNAVSNSGIRSIFFIFYFYLFYWLEASIYFENIYKNISLVRRWTCPRTGTFSRPLPIPFPRWIVPEQQSIYFSWTKNSAKTRENEKN